MVVIGTFKNNKIAKNLSPSSLIIPPIRKNRKENNHKGLRYKMLKSLTSSTTLTNNTKMPSS